MITEESLARANAELAYAENARSGGFQGRARVSARRAAGIVVRSYLENQGIPVGSASAYDILRIYRSQPEISDEISLVIDHLLMQVNQEFQLPAQIDLIADTRRLIQVIQKD